LFPVLFHDYVIWKRKKERQKGNEDNIEQQHGSGNDYESGYDNDSVMGQRMVHGEETSQDKVQSVVNDRRHDDNHCNDNHCNGNDHNTGNDHAGNHERGWGTPSLESG
jgi:hypothetical protein